MTAALLLGLAGRAVCLAVSEPALRPSGLSAFRLEAIDSITDACANAGADWPADDATDGCAGDYALVGTIHIRAARDTEKDHNEKDSVNHIYVIRSRV